MNTSHSLNCPAASVGRLLEFVSEGSNIKIVITVGRVTDADILEKMRSHNIQVKFEIVSLISVLI